MVLSWFLFLDPYYIIQVRVSIAMAACPKVMTVEIKELQILEVFGYKIN